MMFMITTISYSEENINIEELLDKVFGRKLRVGLEAVTSKKIYLKVVNGNAIIKSKGLKRELFEGEVIELTLENGKIKLFENSCERIEINKNDVISIFAISRDGEKFKRFRGDLEIIVRKSKILPINIIPVEEYLYSVVPSEIGVKFEDEAIKAQAVAARTYLYFGLKNKKYDEFDLLDDTSSQMYLGYDKEISRINRLVNETEGEIIKYNGEAINALYYSTSGGITANNEDVWGGEPVAYLRSVNDKGNSEKSYRNRWSYKISKKNLSKIFGFKVSGVEIVSKKNRRVKTVRIKGSRSIKISGNKLRAKVGYSNIFSTLFSVKSSGSYIIFSGRGSGHGVGMAQWGANMMAERGKSYEEIIKHYYTGVELKKAYVE